MTKNRSAKKAARSARTTGDRQYARTARQVGGGQPPAGVPRSPNADGAEHEAADIPVLIFPVVRAGQPPLKVAQSIVDACAYLVRDGEGWYRAAATAWLIPVEPAVNLPPDMTMLSMLLSVRARRPLRSGGAVNQQEIQDLIADALAAVTAVLRQRHGAPAGEEPELMPIGPDKARQVVQGAGQQAMVSTAHPHRSLSEAADEPEAPERREPPYRVVDRENQGWHQVSGGRYEADFGEARGLSDLDYAALEEQRGPLRAVVPYDPGDALLITSALADAGTKAVASVLVALYQVTREYADADSSPGRRNGGTLTAGREGSRESYAMNLLAWEVGSDLADKPSRFDPECVQALTGVLRVWTGQRETYTEVAENLAFLVGQVADELGGWDKIADRFLRPGARVGHPQHVIELARGYLLSTAQCRNE